MASFEFTAQGKKRGAGTGIPNGARPTTGRRLGMPAIYAFPRKNRTMIFCDNRFPHTIKPGAGFFGIML
jgi:hypothetical protein